MEYDKNRGLFFLLSRQNHILVYYRNGQCHKLIYVFVYSLNTHSSNPHYVPGTFLNSGNKTTNPTVSLSFQCLQPSKQPSPSLSVFVKTLPIFPSSDSHLELTSPTSFYLPPLTTLVMLKLHWDYRRSLPITRITFSISLYTFLVDAVINSSLCSPGYPPQYFIYSRHSRSLYFLNVLTYSLTKMNKHSG